MAENNNDTGREFDKERGENQQALELTLKQLKETQSNVEFLMKVSKSVPGQHDKD